LRLRGRADLEGLSSRGSSMNRYFGLKEASRILLLPERKILYWRKIGLIRSAEYIKGRICVDFKGLVALRRIKELVSQGVGVRSIKRCVERLSTLFPHLREPLAEIQIRVDGKGVILLKDSMRFTPEGQLLMDFDQREPKLIPIASDKVEELFFEALRCEEEGRLQEAKERYRRIIELQADHTDALVNMGNLFFLEGEREQAERLYKKALMIDPGHVEANYNLAYLLEGKGRLEDAALFYRRALEEDPSFADACFNMASVLQRLGEKRAAKEFWLRYLELEPDGEGSDLIRRYLDHEEE